MTRLSLTLALGFAVPLVALIALATGVGRGLPAGEQIAYVSKTSAAQWDVLLFDLERGLHVNLTAATLPDAARNRFPVWSPHGERLLFVSDVTGNQDLLLYDLRDRSLRQLTDWRFNDTDPAWSPAGLPRIAYVTSSGSHWDIGVLALETATVQNAGGSGQVGVPARRTIGSNRNEFSPTWSPDGRMLLYVSDRGGIRDLYLSVEGRDMLPLTQGMIASDGGVWSPEGRRVAFAAGLPGRREVYVIDVTTGQLANLSKAPGDDYQPVWSPDGTRVVFVSARSGPGDLYLAEVPADLTRPVMDARPLTNTPYPDYEPAWSPDGTRLIYVAAPGFTSELYLLDVDAPPGTPPRRLTFNRVEDWSPQWRPVSLPATSPEGSS